MELLPLRPYGHRANSAHGATLPGATRTSDFTLDTPYLVTQVMTYHYGSRQPPGMIALQNDDGTFYGPWQAAGAVGQGGVQNAYWWAQPNVAVTPGHYRVINSNPSTWSVEAATRGAGIFVIWGHPN